jgi:digalactosyldiacylglycerol synthase
VLLLLAASAVAQHLRANADKKGELQDLRSQVINMEDFHIAIVTTAALPWMTGTAINPLLRAAYLAKAGKRVTLAVPWLHPKEQALIFPGKLCFSTPEAQEAHIRGWLHDRGGVKADFKLRFYPARYDLDRGSILPLGDITRVFSDSESDICVLEEPEHLNWYHSGANWRHRFKLVVGVVHTNYIYYAKMYLGPAHAALLQRLNVWMCGAYCDKVIKLSDTIQPLPRAIVCNVHGVRAEFLEIGRRASRSMLQRRSGAYFLGKVLWAKGHRLLLDYLKVQKELGLPPTHIDVYGGGEDLEEVKAEVQRSGVDVSFFKATDHSSTLLRNYKAFVNPSLSEVLSTTTAEALAMGKFVVLQRHPSNNFFLQFRNTLAYDTPAEFLQQVEHALAADPAPLSPEERRALSWEGATDRFLEAISNCTLTDVLPTIADHTIRCAGHRYAGLSEPTGSWLSLGTLRAAHQGEGAPAQLPRGRGEGMDARSTWAMVV